MMPGIFDSHIDVGIAQNRPHEHAVVRRGKNPECREQGKDKKGVEHIAPVAVHERGPFCRPEVQDASPPFSPAAVEVNVEPGGEGIKVLGRLALRIKGSCPGEVVSEAYIVPAHLIRIKLASVIEQSFDLPPCVGVISQKKDFGHFKNKDFLSMAPSM